MIQTIWWWWGGPPPRSTPIHFHRSTHGGGGGAVQFKTPTPAVWAEGSADGGGWHKALVESCFPTGLSPLNIPTLCGSELCLIVSTEPLDDLSCLTTLGPAVPEMGRYPCRWPGAPRYTRRVHAELAGSSTGHPLPRAAVQAGLTWPH